jgi:CSLREA domain-containing protein
LKQNTFAILASLITAVSLIGVGGLGATFVVNTTDDGVDVNPGNGVCAADFETEEGDAACTLRAAIQEANARNGQDIIELPAMEFQLSLDGRDEDAAATGDLDITGDVTIRGTTDSEDVNSTVNIQSIDRGFEVRGVSAQFEGFTITAGTAVGAPGGGAIYNNGGSVTLIDMNLNLNSGSVRAGGIENNGDLTIRDSKLDSNSGGGIYNTEDGDLTLQNVEMLGNSRGSGAAIHNKGLITIEDSEFRSNNATTNPGGAIFNDNRLTVNNTLFASNNSGTGGGIFNASGAIATIVESTFQQNLVRGVGGGVVNAVDAIMTITHTTMFANIADDAGGIHNSGNLTLVSSTISGNFVRFTGGGIINEESGTLTLRDSTIHNNSAGMSTGGVANRNGNVQVANSIIAGNNTQGDSPDCSGPLTSISNNLIGDDSGCEGFENGANSDIVGTGDNPVDPALGPLEDNGGPTLTHAVLSNSPARDAGANCESLDQRGENRPRGSACDIGAYES